MTIDEALAASDAEPVNDIFLVDSESRTITVPESEKVFGVYNDGNSERKYFRCPKVVGDGINLSALRLYINYQNANGDKYPYLVDDVQTDGDYITFSWLIGPDAVAYKGQVQFILCAKNESLEWNTTLAEGTVLEGLEATSEAVDRNPDIIEQLLTRMDGVEKTLQEEVTNAETKRKSAESARAKAETERNQAETTRSSNETTRSTNEATRIQNEKDRQTNTADAIAKAKEATELLVNQANTIAFQINSEDGGLDAVILTA